MDIKEINSWLENLAVASENFGDEKIKVNRQELAKHYRDLKDFHLKNSFVIGGSLLGNSPIMRYIEENKLQYDIVEENGKYIITKKQ